MKNNECRIVRVEPYFAEIDAEQKANRPNILNGPSSDLAIGYHNGLTMAKAIALRLAAETPIPSSANWIIDDCDSGEPDGYAAFIEAHCPNCNFSAAIENGQYGWSYGDSFPWRFCPNCGTPLQSQE